MDEALVLCFAEGASFTGETVVELQKWLEIRDEGSDGPFFLSTRRTAERKIKEALLALEIERQRLAMAEARARAAGRRVILQVTSLAEAVEGGGKELGEELVFFG